MDGLTLWAVPEMPIVREGDDIAGIIVERMAAHEMALQPGDIVVIAQKIVSKAEGRLVRLREVEPSAQALELAERVDKDAATVQVILDDSRSVIRARRGLLIVEQSSGWICANAGVDHSNVAPADVGETEDADAGVMLALLPEDADASAARIRERLERVDGRVPVRADQRQPWAALAHRHRGRLYRLCGPAACVGSTGAARSPRI